MIKCRVGVDLSLRGTHLAGVVGSDGGRIRSVPFERTYEGFQKVLAVLQEYSVEEVELVLTPTSTAWIPLATFSKAEGYRVLLVTPQEEHDLREFFKKHAKSDRIDSFVIADVPRVNPEGARELLLPEPLVESLRRWSRERHDMVSHATSIWQRILSILDQTCPTLQDAFGRSLRTGLGKAFLKKYVDPGSVVSLGYKRLNRFLDQHAYHGRCLPAPKKRAIFEACKSAAKLYSGARIGGKMSFDFQELQDQVCLELRRLEFEEKEIEKVEGRLAKLYAEYDPDSILTQPAGIGPISASALVGATGAIDRFSSIDTYKGFTGLVPRKNQTGGKDKTGQRITQHGDSLLRRTYFLAGDTARKYDVEAFDFYHRLRGRGLHHTQAVCAVGAKQAGRFLSLLRRHEAHRKGDASVDLTYEYRDLEGRRIDKAQARAWIVAETERRTKLEEAQKRLERKRQTRAAERSRAKRKGKARLPETGGRHPEARNPHTSREGESLPKTLKELFAEDPELQRAARDGH